MDQSTFLTPALKHILVATDLSPATANVLRYAAQFCSRFGSELYVAHVLHSDVYPFQLPETWPVLADAENELAQKAGRLIRDTLGSIPHELILEKGEVWSTIRNIIKEKNIDLLIAGTHGRSGISKAIVGSVAEEMLRCADCPVLTIGPNVPFSDGSSLKLNRILYATDFSAESLSAVRLAIHLSKLSDAALTLLHCCKNDENKDAMLETLCEVVPFGAGLSSPPECFVKSTSHRHAILDLAHEQGADLIVLGIPRTRWHSKLTTHLTGSITYHVVSRAECPVVTVRN